MAYGGKDGKLDTGFQCFIRPARSKPRKYSLSDLKRIFKYVVAEHGLTEAYCAIAGQIGISQEMRRALDALRDIPCVDTDIVSSIPDDIKEEIEDFTGSSLDELEACDPETNIGEKIKGAVAFLFALLIILRRMLKFRVVAFILKRFFLFGLLVALANKLQDIIQSLLQTAAVVQELQKFVEVLACQRDDNGDLIKISDVFDVPPELQDLGL